MAFFILANSPQEFFKVRKTFKPVLNQEPVYLIDPHQLRGHANIIAYVCEDVSSRPGSRQEECHRALVLMLKLGRVDMWLESVTFTDEVTPNDW